MIVKPLKENSNSIQLWCFLLPSLVSILLVMSHKKVNNRRFCFHCPFCVFYECLKKVPKHVLILKDTCWVGFVIISQLVQRYIHYSSFSLGQPWGQPPSQDTLVPLWYCDYKAWLTDQSLKMLPGRTK